jgi:hypothetical protein
VRFANTLLAALTLVLPVACDGDDEAATTLPVAQRFLTAEDAPGSQPDPVETGRSAADLDEFIVEFEFVAPDEEEMTTVFQEAGFKGAGEDTRFLGETHTSKVPHLISLFIELGSEDGAKNALDWLEADSMKPCPQSCAVQISTFDPGIADARGVRRLTTAQLIETAGTANQRPGDHYWIAFTEGSFVYTMELFGPPGSVSVEQAQEIASAYHDRLTGS